MPLRAPPGAPDEPPALPGVTAPPHGPLIPARGGDAPARQPPDGLQRQAQFSCAGPRTARRGRRHPPHMRAQRLAANHLRFSRSQPRAQPCVC